MNDDVRFERLVAERTAVLQALNQKLREERERIGIAADAAGLGFWTWDLKTQALSWDPRVFALHGIDPETTVTLKVALSTVHPADLGRFEQELSDAVANASAFDSDYRVVHGTGDSRHLRTSARIIRGAAGHARELSGVVFDITERKRADGQFRLAIDAAPTGMLLMNDAGVIVLVNAKVENLFGYARSELLGQKIELLIPHRFRLHHPGFRDGFFGAPDVRAMGAGRDLYGLRKDGTELPVEIGLNPLRTPEGDFVLSSIVDLSHRREIDRMRTDFVSTVSHELRTPLTSINGSLGLLQSGAMGRLPDEAFAMLQIAYKNCGRLVRIVNDILDIGRLESGQLTLQMASLPVGELLRQAVEVNAAFAATCEVRFVLRAEPADACVLADPGRLIQVMTNLLSNAAKFSPPGADVYLTALASPESIRIEVQDFGTGIPESFKSRIFEKFAQADASTTRRFEGSGLGLSIARKLIEAMGGTIGFSSVPGRGATFYIELPRTASAVAAGPPLNATGTR